MRLRVLSWNIHKAIGGVDRRYRLDRVVDYLRHQEADIVLLQEVAEGWPGARYESQAGELARELGFAHHAFGHEHRFRQGGYGNAIFSRFPLRDTEHVDLTIGWRKKRGALQARVVVHTEHERPGETHQRTVVVNNLHLGLAGSERALQLERFLAHDAMHRIHRDTPLVIAGDLNDLYGTLGPRFLEPAGFERAGKRVNTFPAAVPLRPLDGIFFKGALTCLRGAAGRGNLASSASDHLPLVADFEVGF